MLKIIIIVILTVHSISSVYPQKMQEPEHLHGHWGYMYGGERQEPVIHKYLTIMAWDVVRAEHPEVIGTEMDLAMRNPVSGVYGNWWSNEYDDVCTGNIVSGAFREDSEDIIWAGNNMTITPINIKPFVSITHFWLADLGDNHEPVYWGEHRKNAMQKVRALWRGYQYIECGAWPSIELTGYSDYICIEHNPPAVFRYKDVLIPASNQYSLNDIYLNPLQSLVAKELWYMLVLQNPRLPKECMDVRTEPNLPLSTYASRFPQGINAETFRKVCWEVVGRIAHLIEDQGVPAHSHFDTHVPKPPISDEDYYERRYMSDQWHFLDLTSDKALMQGGSIDLTGKQDPLRYALYLANQVADRFPSDDADGNLTIDRNHPDNYAEILDPIYANIKASIYKFDKENPPPGLMEEIAENAGIFSIRATAGFLYWVFQQFQIQPNIPTDIVISNQTISNTRTYIATNSVTTQSTVNITPTSNVTLKAGNFIRLTNGTSIKAGSNFYAKIENITDLFSIYVENPGISANIAEGEAKKMESASNDVLEAFIPKEYSLFQNYPNPFNPETTIQFDIPKLSHVKITVFDITGREIFNFVNSELNPGRYQYKFNGSNLSSGIYFYRIEADAFTAIKKMLLVK